MTPSSPTTDAHHRLMAELRGMFPGAAVLEALEDVPRHTFLPDVSLGDVYANKAITTFRENGQAISSCSQPSWVAKVIIAAGVSTGQRVWEIGSGTGYSAVILARIVGPSGSVLTVDLDQHLVDMTCRNLAAFGFVEEPRPADGGRLFCKTGFGGILTRCQDGCQATPATQPFHAILVTATGSDIARCWHRQLVEGGRLVMPLRVLPGMAVLAAFTKTGDGFRSRLIAPCNAVPLRGDGFSDDLRWDEIEIDASPRSEPGDEELLVLQRCHHQFQFRRRGPTAGRGTTGGI